MFMSLKQVAHLPRWTAKMSRSSNSRPIRILLCILRYLTKKLNLNLKHSSGVAYQLHNITAITILLGAAMVAGSGSVWISVHLSFRILLKLH
jgi:hypothetical protein